MARNTALARILNARSAPPLVLVSVYRHRNASSLQALLTQVPEGTDVRLWALDEVHPALATHTVGSGAAPKFVLVNRLLDHAGIAEEAWVAVADDDVCLSAGNLAEVIGVAARCGFGIAQPSHSWASIITYPLLLSRPWLAARQTGFVESGPLFLVSPQWRSQVFPLPEDMGMGWGIEVHWSRLRTKGCSLGVVDACRMLHLNPVGTTYDRTDTRATLEGLLDAEGVRSVYQLMGTTRRWTAADLCAEP
jgi:hypothetical protein